MHSLLADRTNYRLVPHDLINSIVKVGKFDEWIGNGLNDHVPLVVDMYDE